MSHGKSDAEIVRTTHNTARFFTETRHISWVLLLGTVFWGVYGYFRMPQRKDPDVPVRVAVAICPWPGASAEKIEQLVTRKIEEKIAENPRVDKIESNTRTSVAIVTVELEENAKDRAKEFDDINLKLDSIDDLPQGAGPIRFIKDFGDTASLMLTVASPLASDVEISLRAQGIRKAIEEARRGRPAQAAGTPVTAVVCYPPSIDARMVLHQFSLWVRDAAAAGMIREGRILQGAAFVGLDGLTDRTDAEILRHGDRFVHEKLRASELHPDTWSPFVIRDPGEAEARLREAAGEKYTYRELDDFTDLIKRTLQTVSQVSKVTRSGVLEERVYLEYSQERLAAYGVRPQSLPQILSARNITLPGGVMELEGRDLRIAPSGEFRDENEIAGVLVPAGSRGRPIYLRDLVQIERAYDSPARYLNFFTRRNARGEWERSRAVTLAVQMRAGEKIGDFGEAVDRALADLRRRLPDDLIIARTSDQPLQVEENVHLFMTSLYEAIILVVLVSLVGFWEWRSALLMALSIPITLAMTFGMMDVLGIDIQQVSIASLIIALGLLVDDPVVAGDAIKRGLSAGHPPVVAAWLGPTKLASAILYATITNIVAYLPFLLLTGDTGLFIYSLPVVIAISLVASRVVSMTFIPLLGYYLLRPKAEKSVEERRKSGFASFYYRVGSWAIEHRWKSLSASLVLLAAGGVLASGLKSQFFPKDLSYLSYVDVWLPEDAPLSATRDAAQRAEAIIRETAERAGREGKGKEGKPREILESLTTFLGGGGPRFWFSVSPELQQLNYAQILIQVKDKHDTAHLVAPLQEALSAGVPGARIDVRQLETGKPVGIPVSIRISGDDVPALRRFAEESARILRATPGAERVRDNWGAGSFLVKLEIDPDRANLAGVTNQDVALASATAMNGYQVGTLREGHKQIPVVARLAMDERATLSDIQDLYVYSSQGSQKVPLGLVSSVGYGLEAEKIQRRDQFRTITVSAFPAAGLLPSEVLGAAQPQLKRLEAELPPGYRMEIGGEYEEQRKGFIDLAVVLLISVIMIFLALVVQFRHAVKPFIVFAAIPYGAAGALAALRLMGAPFGFMAFLGVVSLVGVIVSHVIVLFDFIEESHAEGKPLEEALLDAGIMRLRPVLITVGATVFALFPLASHGGPLWEPMCYAQIGGLTVATFVTLLLVPVLYAIFVMDLKLVRWQEPSRQAGGAAHSS
jgi:multidrug efflux pump